MKTLVHVEDHAVAQMMMAAIESYEIMQRSGKRTKARDRIETFGLLWGYVVPTKDTIAAKIIVTHATIETSALRDEDSVTPDFESMQFKKAFMGKYWPNVELVGTFHSHPYGSVQEVREVKGWQASIADTIFLPEVHEELAREQPHFAHLIVTVTKMSKSGWASPQRLSLASEEKAGYEITADDRKLWLRAYSSYFNYAEPENDAEFDTDGEEYDPEWDDEIMDLDAELEVDNFKTPVWLEAHFNQEVELHIPSIERRFA